jgi:carboxypeptidase C (cathepsin A)
MSDPTPETPKAPALKGSSRELTAACGRYQATADWLVLRKQEKPVAEIFYVHYRLLDAAADRPLTFVFNGGPGAASAYLHVGALGPRRVVFNADGSQPRPPARLTDNAETWLAFTDLVFVDPVGTGFSRRVDEPEAKDAKGAEKPGEGDKDKEKEFYKLNRDLDALGEMITKFLSRFQHWSRPIFIAGESYGGFRVAKLARRLQQGFGVGLSGAILISPALEMHLLEGSDYDVLTWIDAFPSMALAALHHGRSRALARGMDLGAARAAAEAFATGDLTKLLVRGAALGAGEQAEICARAAALLGVSDRFVADRGGRISRAAFVRELFRDEGKICGLYDASTVAVDPFPDRESFQGADPTLFAIERAFTGAINTQVREVIGLETERDYHLLNLEVNAIWGLDDRKHAFELQVGATDDLRYGMALNPHMRVFLTHGLYDLVTPYFAADRLVSLMRLQPAQLENLVVQHYHGGHMFYLWEESRRRFSTDIAAFYRSCLS